MSENFDLFRGDYKEIDFEVRGPAVSATEAGPLLDITGYTAVFTMKRQRVDGGSVNADTPAVRKTQDDISEIVFRDQSSDDGKGRGYVILVENDTKFLEEGIYLFDIRVRPPDGRPFTISKGRVYLQGNVSSAEDLSSP